MTYYYYCYYYYLYVWVDETYKHIYQIQISQKVAVRNLIMKYINFKDLLFKICDYASKNQVEYSRKYTTSEFN